MSGSLETALRLAGATLVEEEGRLVALDHGSVGGELAACRQAVGVAARLDAVVLELHGPADELAWLAGAGSLTPGQAVRSAQAWVVPESREHVLVIADPRRDATELRRLRASSETSEVACSDESRNHDVLVLLGPSAEGVLDEAELEREGDLPALSEVSDVVLAGSPVQVVRVDTGRFLLLTDPAHSVATWHALQDAGRRFGIASVGREALERLEIGGHAGAGRAG